MMTRELRFFILIFLSFLLLDQVIKYAIVEYAKTLTDGEVGLHDFVMIAPYPVISIALVFNTGVAFSFLTWVGEWLKFIQIVFIAITIIMLYTQKKLFSEHYIAFGLMLAGGTSNVLDRFVYGGVVDYIYWHYLFDFPIFNFADIIIDCGIALFILRMLLIGRREARANKAKS